ncbi:MAG: MBL fold metallo-hydrolase [Anaerolineales bacterium]|jgi:L-ascorbate metabolism protein UlaG (beta-lactamase superfamily)
MELTWYGLSCFRMIERGLASVVADPYDHAAVGYDRLNLKADIVTVSHDAPGHNFVAGVKGKEHVLTGPGEYEIGGVFITAVRTNGKKRSSDELPNTLYVFDFDGVTVAHMGDLTRVPSQADVEALGDVSVALVPVGGGAGLNAAKAAEVISLLEPGIVVPMQFQTPDIKLDLDPLEKFLKELGIGEITPEPTLKVTRSAIPDETKVVVLEPRT